MLESPYSKALTNTKKKKPAVTLNNWDENEEYYDDGYDDGYDADEDYGSPNDEPCPFDLRQTEQSNKSRLDHEFDELEKRRQMRDRSRLANEQEYEEKERRRRERERRMEKAEFEQRVKQQKIQEVKQRIEDAKLTPRPTFNSVYDKQPPPNLPLYKKENVKTKEIGGNSYNLQPFQIYS